MYIIFFVPRVLQCSSDSGPWGEDKASRTGVESDRFDEPLHVLHQRRTAHPQPNWTSAFAHAYIYYNDDHGLNQVQDILRKGNTCGTDCLYM